jgi:hypothetical protein
VWCLMNTNKRVLLTATAMVAALALSACSEPPKPAAKAEAAAPKEPAKAPEAITALPAFYQLYKPAREWAADLLVLSASSGEVPNIKNEDGKAGLWTVVFVSPSRKEARKFTWAVADSGADIRKGLNVSDALPWNGATPDSKTFTSTDFAVDSDAAYKTGLAKAADWLKTHPDQKVTFSLGDSSKFPSPVWYIQWGTTKNGYAALVNATTGMLVK